MAWAIQLAVDYSLDEVFACAPGNGASGEIAGIPSSDVALLVSGVLLAIAIAAGIVAFRCYAKLRGTNGEDTPSRARWMALAGILNSILYVIVIAASFAPPLLLRACESSS